MKKINILFPVYNEQKRLESGISRTVQYFKKISFNDYLLTIVDNASTDRTGEIAKELEKKYKQVKYIRLESKGVGVAFREGVKNNNSEIVGYMDVDLSTDINHIKDVIDRFDNDNTLDIVNASRLNKHSDLKGRKWYRNITSYGLPVLLKFMLNLKATDAICGFKFFKRNVVEKLIKDAGNDDNGWFYIIELLLRAERKNLNIYELPVCWQDDYRTTVKVLPLIKNYCKQIFIVRKKFKQEGIL